MRRLIAITLLCFPVIAACQDGSRTISPGMTRAQVTEALGQPSRVTSANDHSYLFYQNSCGRSCGMDDLVILQKDSVVDAIFRSPNRHYTGTSSSPAQVAPAVAARPRSASAGTPMKIRKDSTAAKAPAPAAKTTTDAPKQMAPPTTGNDTRPSIPTKPEPVKPAPATKPAQAHDDLT